MIRLLDEFDGSGLISSHCSAQILSHLSAYGVGFDFCRFYEIVYRRRVGVICVFNGSVSVGLSEGAKNLREAKRELSEFLDFSGPSFCELPPEFAPRQGFQGFEAVPRTFFEVLRADSSDGLFEPDPATVFKTVFSSEQADYGVWLTDTLRRVNLGISRLYGFESSVLTVRFILGGKAFISDVATPYEDRGKGFARELLGRVSKALADDGISAYLCADPEAAGFYRSLGYPEIGSDRAFRQRATDPKQIFKNTGERK